MLKRTIVFEYYTTRITDTQGLSIIIRMKLKTLDIINYSNSNDKNICINFLTENTIVSGYHYVYTINFTFIFHMFCLSICLLKSEK